MTDKTTTIIFDFDPQQQRAEDNVNNVNNEEHPVNANMLQSSQKPQPPSKAQGEIIVLSSFWLQLTTENLHDYALVYSCVMRLSLVGVNAF